LTWSLRVWKKITAGPLVFEKYLRLGPSHSKYTKKFTQKSPKNSHTSQEPYLLRQDPPITPKISGKKTKNPPEKSVLPLKASKALIFATITPILVILAPKFSKSFPFSFYTFTNTCLLHFID
jgi:hypothetical protein